MFKVWLILHSKTIAKMSKQFIESSLRSNVEHSIYQRGQGPKCRQNRYNFGTWILRPPPPLPKCSKFSTDQHLGFCLDPLPPFGPMSQILRGFFGRHPLSIIVFNVAPPSNSRTLIDIGGFLFS